MTSVKKRQRIILVCDNCHHRKIKCNRQLPCDSCTNRGIQSLCKYSALEKELSKQGKSPESMFPSKEPKDGELVMLRNRLKELEALIGVASLSQPQSMISPGFNDLMASDSPIRSNSSFPTPMPLSETSSSVEETTDFLATFGSSTPCIRLRETFATSFPLSFISLLKRDSGYTVFWHFNRSKTQQFKFTRHIVDGVGALLDKNDPDVTKDMELKARDYFGDSYIPKFEKSDVEDNAKKQMNLYGSKNGILFFDGYIPPNCNYYLKMTYLLPPKFIILDYLTVWFDKLASYFPIFEKTSFISEIDNLISEGTDTDPKVSFNLEKKVDLARLSSLFFILRLTYLFIIRSQTTSTEFISLLSYPISVDAAGMGRQCLKEFNLSTNHSFDVLQTFVVAKIFKTYAPDEGDGVRETDMYITALINGACVCGLNRDPDIFTHDDLTWIAKNHRRKLWYFLLGSELMESTLYGQPLYNMAQSDVMLEEANGENDDATYYTLRKMLPIRSLISEIIPTLMNIQQPVNLKTLKNYVIDLELLVDQAFGSVDQVVDRVLNNFNDPKATMDCYHLLSMKIFVAKMYFCLYLIYEKRHDVDTAFKYYKRMLNIIFLELNPFASILVEQETNIDPMFSIVLGALAVRFFFISVLLGVTAVLHLNYTIKLYMGTEEKPKHLLGLLKDFQSFLSHILRYSGKLSSRYFVIWKATRASIYSLDETRDLRTFDEMCQGKNASWIFTSSQMHELCDILHVVVSKCEPYNSPRSSLDFLWLNVVPYDATKTEEENLLLQRLHVHQIDTSWHHYTSYVQETIPKDFQNDGISSIPNILNADLMSDTSMISGLGGLFSVEDMFLSDAYYKL